MRRLVGFRSLLKSKLDVATRRLERAIWFYSFTGFYFLCGKLVRGFPLRFNLSHIYYLHTVHAQKTDIMKNSCGCEIYGIGFGPVWHPLGIEP